MKRFINYFIVALIFFEVAITCVAAYSEGWESKTVGIGLLLTLITALFIPTKKWIWWKYF